MARSETQWASIAQVEAQVTSWSDGVLHCRTKPHGFKQHNATHFHRYRYWLVEFRCVFECGVVRWEEWNEQFVVTNNWLEYPKNSDGTEAYLMPPGMGRLSNETRGPVRREQQERMGFQENIELNPQNAPRPRTRDAVGAPRKSSPRKRAT